MVSASMWSVASCFASVVFGQSIPEPGNVWDLNERMHEAIERIAESQIRAPTPAPQVSHVRIPMSDGAKLYSTITVPYPYDQKRSAVMDRTPYGVGSSSWANLGFVMINQQQRGTFYSGGTFDLWRTDDHDAHESITWIINQSWSDGQVYTVGASADGIGQLVLSLDPHPALKGQWVTVAPYDGHDFAYPGGGYRKDLVEGYLGAMTIPIHGVSKSVIAQVKTNEAYDEWWSGVTVCYNTSEPQSEGCHYPSTNWPTIQQSGWWDIFMEPQITGFNNLRKLSDPSIRDKHVLIMAALGHCTMVLSSDADDQGNQVAADLAYEYFTGVFDGPTRSRIGRYNLWIMGDFDGATVGNYWTSLDEFPISTPLKYMLQADGSLATSSATKDGSVTYTYDPSDPAPMLGGNNLPGIGNVPGCGTYDQLARENRSDVLVFDSAVLEDDLAVVGVFHAQLFISTDVPDTDFVVTLSDLSPGATTSMLVSFGIRRMRLRDGHRQTTFSEPLVKDQIYQVDVELNTKAYIFPKGHQVRVSVASAAEPYFNANRNTGTLESTSFLVANQVIHIAPDYPSSIALPVVQLEDISENVNFVKPATQNLVV